jgi:predicted DNA binding protein
MSVLAEFHAPVGSYPLGTHLSAHPSVPGPVEPAVPVGGVVPLVRGRADDDAAFVEATAGTVEATVAVVDTWPDSHLLRVTWPGTGGPLLTAVGEADGTLLSATGTASGWTLRARFPGPVALDAFVTDCEERALGLRLLERHRARDRDDRGLTGRQEETLRRALEAGYFEVPRAVTLGELAADLGVSEQAVSERLRRGLASLLATTALAGEPGSGTVD